MTTDVATPTRRAAALLWRAAQPDVRQLWLGLFGLLLAAGLDALGPVLGKAFIDRYLLPRDPQLGAMLGLLGGALLAGCVASWLRYVEAARDKSSQPSAINQQHQQLQPVQ